MKSLSVKLGIMFFIIGLIIFGNIEAWGADWKLFLSTDEFLVYYDAQSITRSSKNIIRVQVRHDYTKTAVINMVRELGKKYENLSYMIGWHEINCVEKKFCILSAAQCDNKGKVIFSLNPPLRWISISPELWIGVYIKKFVNRKEVNP